MQEADRKVLRALVFTVGVAAAMLAWIAFVGPANNNADQETYKNAKDLFLGFSPEAWTAIFTAVLTASTIGLWLQTKRLAEGAEGQADLTDKIFVAQHRPWISIRAINIALGINDGMVVSNVELKIENVGKSPAIRVQCRATLSILGPGTSNIGEISKKFFDQALATERKSSDWLGIDILPGQDIKHRIIISTPPDTPKITNLNVGHTSLILCATCMYFDGQEIGQTGCVCNLSPITKPEDFEPLNRFNWDAYAEADSGVGMGRAT